MRLDEDYLRELELWPMFALKPNGVARQPASSAALDGAPLEVAPLMRPQAVSAPVAPSAAASTTLPPVGRSTAPRGGGGGASGIGG